MDDIDRAILNRIQSDFPIFARPYHVIADGLGLDEATVIARVNDLKQQGIIRRIGGNFSPEKLGFVSTLCAAKVSHNKISDFARIVNRYPGVTHNYRRDNEYNVWFTFIARSQVEIERHLADISAESGVTDLLNLPAIKVFKIRAHFEL